MCAIVLKLKTIYKKGLLIEALVCGAVIFIAIYGVRVLNPMYTDWLMTGEDLTQHYLGWCYFRTSDWSFPIGLYDGLSYPFHTSIIFTDSIPLFAVLFKLISFALPENFQYFGWWGIMCFSLQCMLGSIICKKYTDKNIIALLGGVLLTISPVMIFRMYMHTALAGQWLILLAMLPLIYTEKFENRKKNCAFWLVVGVLCCSIHIYYIIMCGIILCGYVLKRCIIEKNLPVFLYVVPYVVGGLLAIILLGGFSAGVYFVGGGFGTFGANLNTFFNTQGHALLLENLGYYGDYQYEGFGYLGAGILVLSVISSVTALRVYMLQANSHDRKTLLTRALPYIVAFLMSFILAVIPNVAFNKKLLFKIPLPDLFSMLMDVIRANGRFIWVCVYLIAVASVTILIRKYKSNVALIVLTICILIQTYDLSEWLSEKHVLFSTEQQYETLLTDEKWEKVADMNFEHVYISESLASKQEMLYSFAKWANENGLILNTFYFARTIPEINDVWTDKITNPEDTDLFIFDIEDNEVYSCMDNVYVLDGYVIGTSTPISGM